MSWFYHNLWGWLLMQQTVGNVLIARRYASNQLISFQYLDCPAPRQVTPWGYDNYGCG